MLKHLFTKAEPPRGTQHHHNVTTTSPQRRLRLQNAFEVIYACNLKRCETLTQTKIVSPQHSENVGFYMWSITKHILLFLKIFSCNMCKIIPRDEIPQNPNFPQFSHKGATTISHRNATTLNPQRFYPKQNVIDLFVCLT